jgi:hypothetical protein
MAEPGDEYRRPLTVRVTGGSAAGGYNWEEVFWSDSADAYAVPDSPRKGTATLFERNGVTVSVNYVADARLRAVVDGEPTYEFSA